MTLLWLFCLTRLALYRAEECLNCHADDVALLQEKSLVQDKKHEQGIPDLNALKDVLGNAKGVIGDAVSKATDFASKGLVEVSDQLGHVLDQADAKLKSVEADCNLSFDLFFSGSSPNASLSQNLTKLKMLLNGTVGKLAPLYDATASQVSNGFDMAKKLLAPVGLDDEAEKLGACAKSVAADLSSLKKKSEAVLADAKDSSVETLGTALEKMNNGLDEAKSMVGSLAAKFDSQFEDFTNAMVKQVTSKLPAGQKDFGAKMKAVAGNLTSKVHMFCTDLQSTVVRVGDRVEESGQMVDAAAAKVASSDFFGKVGNFFKHLFR
mmetsp:Transcript_18593/g.34888  ORF Transcript_18593/g.34888 Transcript_18593/m.34888 type:complete len:322 (+) Transcript_18593:75-1040(+)